ncbi:MAG: immune inhibitor A [Muribaculaceae bacterium]|nr:immune inhibitor A [Muribaculaceae bacterium]
MRKTVNLLLALFFASTLSMWAVPAKRGFLTYTQSDGTTIRVQTLGDEHFHSLATEDGLIIKRNSDGDFCYASAKGITTTLAHNKTDRTISEVSFIEGMGNALNFSEASSSTSISRRIIARVEEAQRASQVPYIGKVKVPIIVVDYADKKVSNSLQAFKTHFSDDTNSARQYFVDQSNGKFEPQFDVYGVYTLSENRAAYGANLSNGDDQGVGKMVAEACDLAQANSSINWADYDNDGDRMCDVVIVVYAGVGEAQASTTVPESVWPCQWTLVGAANSGDGPGAKTYDGIIVNKFAVFKTPGLKWMASAHSATNFHTALVCPTSI